MNEVILKPHMVATTQGESRTALKALQIYCWPEFFLADPTEVVPDSPLLQELEIAVSSSAAQRGLFGRLGKKWPVYSSSEEDSLIQKLPLFDLMLVSPLSLNTLAKFALGLQDSFPSRILHTASRMGKPILLASAGIPQGDSIMNPHLLKVYRHYWNKVLGGTIREFTPETLDTTIGAIIRHQRMAAKAPPPGGRTVITRDDILLARESLAPVKVPRGALVTDLAREEAKAHGIPLEFE